MSFENFSELSKQKISEYFSERTKYWSLVYDGSKSIRNRQGHTIVRRQEVVLSLLNEYAGTSTLKVVDVGCGTGVILEAVAECGHRVFGVDMSSGMLSKVRERIRRMNHGRISCFQGDIEALPFGKNSFDALLGIGVIQYLENFNKAVSEISRVVRHGGVAIVTLPNLLRLNNWFDPYYYTNRLYGYLHCKIVGTQLETEVDVREELSSNKTFKNRRFVYGQLRPLFRKHGLVERTAVGVGYTGFTFWGKELLPQRTAIVLSDLLESISSKKAFSWLKFFADRWVICLEKA
jgi:ubiquinone/menaquinone biosynthesis C-methylase UbiE